MKKLSISTLVLTALLFAHSAFAGSITYTNDFSNKITDISNEQLRVGLFDESLGTLTGVTVTLSAALSSAGTVTNTSATGAPFTVTTLCSKYNAAVADDSPLVLTDFEVIKEFTRLYGQEYNNLGTGESSAFGLYTYNTDETNVYKSTDTADLIQFIGTGTFGYDLSTEISTLISGSGGNASTEIVTNTGATLSVTYTYDESSTPNPVPEPATFVLFGLGMLGLARIQRKIRK